VAQSSSPPIRLLRLYSDDQGESHFSEETSDTLGQGAATAFSLRVVPPGWQRDWGPTSQPTIAIYVSGEGVVEASDGDSRSVHPGVILIAEDTRGRGHAARVVGDRPLAVMHVTPS
jgi:hypothetical protein